MRGGRPGRVALGVRAEAVVGCKQRRTERGHPASSTGGITGDWALLRQASVCARLLPHSNPFRSPPPPASLTGVSGFFPGPEEEAGHQQDQDDCEEQPSHQALWRGGGALGVAPYAYTLTAVGNQGPKPEGEPEGHLVPSLSTNANPVPAPGWVRAGPARRRPRNQLESRR
ncbi:unnamed protein product [Arctogadus glacialis]